MNVSVSYSVAALHEAAHYIWNNNPHVRVWPSAPTSPIDVADRIKEVFITSAKQNRDIIVKEKHLGITLRDSWNSWDGTGGFYLIYTLVQEPVDDLVEIDVVILVDPSLKTPNKGYITEIIDNVSIK